MYYPQNNCPNCPTVCHALPQKDYFPTRPFIPSRNSSHTSAVVLSLSQIHTMAQKSSKFTSRRCRLGLVRLSIRYHHRLHEHLHPTNL